MKDPAVLFYVNDWLTSTAEMDSDVRGWYLNLILHNYDKKSLPNDIEKLAVLAGVKFSEFNRFEQVFKQVLKQKFVQDKNGRISNHRTDDILKSRETFQDKRSSAGKISYIMKYMAKNFTKEYKNIQIRGFVKDNFDLNTDLKNEQVLKQVFEHLFELYLNENENENRNVGVIKNKKGIDLKVENEKLKIAISEFMEHRKSKRAEIKTQMQYDKWLKKLQKDSGNNPIRAIELIDNAIAQGWTGIYEQSGTKKITNDSRRSAAEIDREHRMSIDPGQNLFLE